MSEEKVNLDTSMGIKEIEEALSRERSEHYKCRTERNDLSQRLKREKKRFSDLEKENAELRSRCGALEILGFEERTKSAEKLKVIRSQCLEDAVEIALEVVTASTYYTNQSFDDDESLRKKNTPENKMNELIASAKQLIEKIDTEINIADAGAALRETLFAIAHPYGTPPPLDPTLALPAAVSCVEFAISASLTLLSIDDPLYAPSSVAPSTTTTAATAMSRPLLNVSSWMIRKLATSATGPENRDETFSKPAQTEALHSSQQQQQQQQRPKKRKPILNLPEMDTQTPPANEFSPSFRHHTYHPHSVVRTHQPRHEEKLLFPGNNNKEYPHPVATTIKQSSLSPPRSPTNPFLDSEEEPDHNDEDKHSHQIRGEERFQNTAPSAEEKSNASPTQRNMSISREMPRSVVFYDDNQSI